VKRLPWPLFIALSLAALVARWKAPALLPWLTRALLALLALRVLAMAFEARAKLLPWTRLLLPAVLLVEGLGLAVHPSPLWSALKLASAAVLELALLVFLLLRMARLAPEPGVLPEDHLAKPLEAFLPPRAARLIALEFVVIGGGLRFLFGGWRRPDPPGFSYHRESVLGPFLLALPLLMAADVLLLDLLLRRFSPWIRWSVHGLDLYGLLWVFGLWASMRARPHRIEDGAVHLHHGFLGSLSLRRDQIEGEEQLPAFGDDWARLRYMKGVAQLAVPGPDQVLLKLREPLAATGLLGRAKAKERVLVAVDDVQSFRAALDLLG
jgi:hypothetical protein